MEKTERLSEVKYEYETIIRMYTHSIRPKAQVELDWFRHQPALKSTIECAALAVNSRGKRYRHQSRLKRVSLEQARQVLLENSRVISSSGNFDDLFDLLDAILKPISGLGELYIYDTSLRIGAKLDLFPERVYLHAGTRIGAQALGFDGKAKTLDVSMLPSEFQVLEPYEIEDVLCIFKAKLKAGSTNRKGDEIIRHCWCS